MLLRWSESHSSGRTVTFQLPEKPGDHPFKGIKCGPANGQRLALALAFIDDDETEIPVKKNKKSLTKEAAICCDLPVFQKFLIEKYSAPGTLNLTCDEAADIVRHICGVKSRSEFDKTKQAAYAWESLWSRYRAWDLAG